MAGEVGGPAEKDFDGASTIGKGQPVHADSFLLPAHRGIAGAKRHQRLAGPVMEEDIHLVGGKHLGDQGGGLIERCCDVGGWEFQQSFQRG